MAKHDSHLDDLCHALSDPTRRMMLTRLARGPAAVTELAGPTGLRLPTVLRHLSVLEGAGLMTSIKDGRVRSCALQPEALTSMRDWLEAQRLQASVEAMRHAYLANMQGGTTLKPSMERRLDEIAQSTKQAESTLASFASRRDGALTQASADRKAALATPPPDAQAEQPALALGTPAEALRAPLSVNDFIRALQFPESPDDKDGFRALRLALEDRDVAKLIRAAQDVLTLLSQEGIYMDDLKPDRAHPDIWRRFAKGERGRAIAGLGGIRDRSSLALTAARMREDAVFRDAAHHFLRSFDRAVAAFEPNATDTELAQLAETRTARAFMIFGRAMGLFD